MLGLDTNKVINAYWWRPSKGPHNFGDELGAIILRKLGYRVRRVSFAKADVLLTGTMVDPAETKNPNATLIGTGSGHEHESVHNFNVLAARGALTAANLKVEGVPLGDLGLLASLIWPKQPPKYNIGIVRHYVDSDEYGFGDLIIDASAPAEQVIQQISSCRVIFSSSLHGLIVADSYGIPNMRIARDDVITGNYKWLDYKSAFVKPLGDIQFDLIEALKKL